jgi:hypothetical protein
MESAEPKPFGAAFLEEFLRLLAGLGHKRRSASMTAST